MEGLNEDKRGVIGTPLYPNLTLEKLREVLNEILNKPREPQMNIADMMKYQSPEAQEAFHKAIIESANNWTIKENPMDTTGEYYAQSELHKEIYEKAKQKFEQSSTGKTRKKNTHLTPKKKKRKR